MVISELSSFTWLSVDRLDDDIYADENGTILNYTNMQAPDAANNNIGKPVRLAFLWSYT